MTGIEPPPEFTVSPLVHNTATGVAALVWLTVAGWALWLARRHRTATPLVIMLGGALTVGYEPVVDVLGKCYLPENYQWTLFEVLDRGMPVYAVLVYSAFFGGFALSAWNHLRGGGAPGGLWRKYGVAMLVNTFLFETPAVSVFHVYTYYGDQPFDLWGFPLWWPFVNTVGPLAAGALVYGLTEVGGLRGGRLLVVATLLIPMTDGAANGAAAYPTWLALNSAVPAWLTWCAGALTVALACLIMHGVVSGLGRLAAARRPAVAVAAP